MYSKYVNIYQKNALEQISESQCEHIIWDLDGTLYSMGKIVKRIKLSVFFKPWNFLEIYNFKKTEKKISKERLNHSFKLDEYIDDFCRMQKFINSYIDESIYNNHAVKFLKHFDSLNKKQYVISEYPIADKLDRLNLSKYFIQALSSPDDFKCWKPNPQMAKDIVKRIDLSSGFVIIGDRDDTDGVLYKNICNLLNH